MNSCRISAISATTDVENMQIRIRTFPLDIIISISFLGFFVEQVNHYLLCEFQFTHFDFQTNFFFLSHFQNKSVKFIM